MTTEAGRRLLAIPLIDGDDAPLDLTEEVRAIESEARAAALREVAEKVRALPSADSLIGNCYNVEQVLAILTEATDRGQRTPAVGASE